MLGARRRAASNRARAANVERHVLAASNRHAARRLFRRFELKPACSERRLCLLEDPPLDDHAVACVNGRVGHILDLDELYPGAGEKHQARLFVANDPKAFILARHEVSVALVHRTQK